MFKYYFDRVENVEIWPIISLIIFFVFFIGLIIWLIKMDKSYINKMKNLPLEHDQKVVFEKTENK
ncbi:MAG: cytochrome C oxidase Cbb3 [Cyclobacteriaceae bacterium]|nr:cytochrome C oxidase Cbb3 [Cyclobacteriaceae bacterium]